MKGETTNVTSGNYNAINECFREEKKKKKKCEKEEN